MPLNVSNVFIVTLLLSQVYYDFFNVCVEHPWCLGLNILNSVRLNSLYLLQRQFRRKTGAEELQSPSWGPHAQVLRPLPGELLRPLCNMSGVCRRKTPGSACSHLVQSIQHTLEVSFNMSVFVACADWIGQKILKLYFSLQLERVVAVAGQVSGPSPKCPGCSYGVGHLWTGPGCPRRGNHCHPVWQIWVRGDSKHGKSSNKHQWDGPASF